MAVDGSRLTAGSMRVRDRVEVWLVDDSTGTVVARLDPEHAGRLANELVTAAVLTRGHTPPEDPAER